MTSPSVLDRVNEYLALRRGLDFDLDTPSWLLRDFARYADRVSHPAGHVTTDLAVQWALSSRSPDPAQAIRRLSTVRVFARHLAVFDPCTEIPPVGLLGRLPRRKPPHIYSEAEVGALLRQASLLAPRGGLRPKTYITFFSLLLSSGLRLSEACRLTCRDVDLANGVLTVQEGKFRKSRLVPLHPTATRALTHYATCRNACRSVPRSEYFFRTDRVPALTRAAVEKTFSRLRNRLGWTAQGRTRRPRIHDLRHSFASHAVMNGIPVPVVSRLLGHSDVKMTLRYAHLADKEIEAAAQRVGAALAQVMSLDGPEPGAERSGFRRPASGRGRSGIP